MGHAFHSHPAHPRPVGLNQRPIILHVNVCVNGRRRILFNSEVMAALVHCWPSATQWVVGYFMIMPDHIHLFCAPNCLDPEPVRRWSGYWKRLAGKTAPILKGAFQEDCWDTQMRSGEHYHRKQEYVANNPVRAGLVECSEDWPWQGRVAQLPWLGGP